MTLDVITYFYRYNSWATERVLNAMEKLTPEEYAAPGCSAHGSIRDTFAHFMDAQLAWFSWYDGSKTIEEITPTSIHGEDISTVALARERWAPIAAQTDAFINTLTEARINEDVSESAPDGTTLTAKLWRLMLHTTNHGTHTRAQIVAAIRRAGHDPGNVELLNFVLSDS